MNLSHVPINMVYYNLVLLGYITKQDLYACMGIFYNSHHIKEHFYHGQSDITVWLTLII